MGRKWLMILQALVAILYGIGKAYSEDSWEFSELSIDCGATNISNPDDIPWRTEDGFIESGQNKIVSKAKTPKEMSTLRFFPDGGANCYNLPLVKPSKYLLRAGFYYGNYDDLSNPPTFELRFNGNFWANVSTSSNEEPIYVEAIYPVNQSPLSVCLIQTQPGEIPFISSLEATSLPNDFYRLTDSNTAFRLWNRSHFGGEDDIGRPSVKGQGEMYNRVWKLRNLFYYRNITSEGPGLDLIASECENWPPYKVVGSAISQKIDAEPIAMSIDFPERTEFSAYFVLYFKEPIDPLPPYGSVDRRFQVYIDGELMITSEVSSNQKCEVVSLYPVRVSGPVSVTILPKYGSDDQPILNAMEVFTALKLSNGGVAPSCSSVFLLLLLVLVGLIIFG